MIDLTRIESSIIRKFLLTRMKNQEESFIHSPYALEQQLHTLIIQGNYELAYEILKRINSLKRATLAKTPIRSLKNSLICSCTLFTRAVIQGGVHPEIAFNLSDVYINEIENTDHVKSLEELEFAMLAHFIQSVNEEKKLSYSHTINRVMTYIHDHILHEISLERIAQEVFLHPNYLSHLFKKEVGISLTDFINQRRIEESKYFLLHTSSSISDIALLFHFCNQSYYTVLFKRFAGLTPKEYRKLHTPA